jgi:hypothetical protein
VAGYWIRGCGSDGLLRRQKTREYRVKPLLRLAIYRIGKKPFCTPVKWLIALFF